MIGLFFCLRRMTRMDWATAFVLIPNTYPISSLVNPLDRRTMTSVSRPVSLSVTSLDGFRGKLSQTESEDPAAYERVQFMKHFGA